MNEQHFGILTYLSAHLHIFISLLAISALALVSVQAILMGLQNYLLKHHRPSPWLRFLPPLQTMEKCLFHTITFALLLLSGSLFSGLSSHEKLLTPLLLPKIILAFCAWGLFILLLIGRRQFGWRGATAIRWTLSGVLLVFLSYFGTKMLCLP